MIIYLNTNIVHGVFTIIHNNADFCTRDNKLQSNLLLSCTRIKILLSSIFISSTMRKYFLKFKYFYNIAISYIHKYFSKFCHAVEV